MKKKFTVLLVSFSLAAMAVLGGMIYQKQLEIEGYQRQISHGYAHALQELASNLSEIDTALQKCQYCTSPELTTALCTDIYGSATAAAMALGEIPFSAGSLEQTAAFIGKVGDYAYVLSRSAASGEGHTEEELESLAALSDTASVLSGNLTRVLSQVQEGGVTIEDLTRVQAELDEETQEVSGNLDRSFSLMETEFPEIPSLIYDGPFSDHVLQMTPRLVEDDTEISQEEAWEIAAEFADLKKEIFTFSGGREGNLPTYNFSAKVDGGDFVVEVSRQGGVVVSALNSRIVSASPLTVDDGRKIAGEFLDRIGYENMKESYWVTAGNEITINYAYTQDGVICYPDLVKITVALDNGRVTGFEAMGYVMSHTEREIPLIEVGEEEAREHVPESLDILSHGMAIIPTGGKYEVFCHEFKCRTGDDQHYIVYVNAVTGQQEDILILLEDDTGTLTI